MLMNSRLDIQDWLTLGQQANWSVTKLAKLCGVSARTLERYFIWKVGKIPKAWLIEQRQRRAMELLRSGCLVKETAAELGYRYAHHFSRAFKVYWGFSPSTQTDPNKPTAGNRRIWV